MNISICLIAKDEASHIETCLQKLSSLDSEIIVVDTGSTDETVLIAERSGAKVFHFDWIQDFSAARNYAASCATYNTILSIDCDEYLEDPSSADLETYLQDHRHEIGVIDIVNRIIKEDGTDDLVHEPASRCYDRRLYQYVGAVHETLAPIEVQTTSVYYDLKMTFQHVGYLTPEVRRNKSLRDKQLLIEMQKQTPDDPYILYQLGKCEVSLGNQTAAISWFEKALNQNPDLNLQYVQNLLESYGYSLLEQKRSQEALALTAFSQDYDFSSDYMFLLGLIYMNNGAFPDAIRSFQQAISCPRCANEGTNSYKAWYNMGVIQEVLGNTSEALYCYQSCGSYAPAAERIQQLPC